VEWLDSHFKIFFWAAFPVVGFIVGNAVGFLLLDLRIKMLLVIRSRFEAAEDQSRNELP
jgi:hypothetical protein